MVILAAVDRTERALRIVAEAANLADAFDDEIHVVHVLTQSEFVNLGRTNVENSEDSLDMDRVRDVAADIAENAIRDEKYPAKPVGLMGDPADSILRYAEKTNPRYIVVGPRNRSPTGKVLFGSVAQSVLLNADSPVVTTISK